VSVCLPQLSTGAAQRAADLLLWAIEVTKRRHLAYARVDCNGDLLLRMNTRVDKQHDSWSTTHHRRVYVQAGTAGVMNFLSRSRTARISPLFPVASAYADCRRQQSGKWTEQ